MHKGRRRGFNGYALTNDNNNIELKLFINYYCYYHLFLFFFVLFNFFLLFFFVLFFCFLFLFFFFEGVFRSSCVNL